MANKKTNLTQTVIAFKKLSGVTNTSITKTDLSETIGTSVQISSNQIFGEAMPTSSQIPSVMYDTDADNRVQLIQFDLVPIAGTNYSAQSADSEAESTTITTHSFALKLKSNYESLGGANPNAGTPPFTDSNYASGSSIQLVPPSYGIQYGITLLAQNGSAITTGDDMDWYFDYASGILFRQDGDNTTIPVSGSCYMYIGNYADAEINEATSLTLGQVVANGSVTSNNISVGPIFKIDYGGAEFGTGSGVIGLKAYNNGGNRELLIGDDHSPEVVIKTQNLLSASYGFYTPSFTADDITASYNLVVGGASNIRLGKSGGSTFNSPITSSADISSSTGTIYANSISSSAGIDTKGSVNILQSLKVGKNTYISAGLDTTNLANSPYGGVLVFNTGSGEIFYTSSIGGGGGTFPFTGNAKITGSLVVSQSAVSSYFTGDVTASTWYATTALEAGAHDASSPLPNIRITGKSATGYESGSVSRRTFGLDSNNAGGKLTLYTSNSANITLENGTGSLSHLYAAGTGSFTYLSASDKAVLGAATIEGDINKVSQIYLQSDIIHFGDTDTKISFGADTIILQVGGDTSYTQTATSTTITNPLTLTNPLSASVVSASSGFIGDLTGTASHAITASYAANVFTPTLQQVTSQGSSSVDTLQLAIVSASAINTPLLDGLTSITTDQLLVNGTGVGNYVLANTFYVNSGITHSGDLDTAIDFDTNEISLTAGGNTNITISTNSTQLHNPVTASIVSASSGFTGSLLGTSSYSVTASTTNLLQSLTANQPVGAISSGDTFAAGTSIETLLRTMLITFIQSSIGSPSFKNNGSTVGASTREVNSSFDVDQVTFTAVANDPDGNYPINLTVTASGADTGNFTNDLTSEVLGASNTFDLDSDPYTLNITSISSGFSKNITLTIKAEDPDNSAALTGTRNYTYIYPYYWGESATDLSAATGTTVESTLTKVLGARANKTHSIAASAEYIYFAYPTLYGNLASILDGTNVDVLPGNFTKYTLSLDGGNGWTGVSYNLYRSNTVTTVTGNYKFNFT